MVHADQEEEGEAVDMPRKASNKAIETATAIDKVLAEIDPTLAAAMVLGGTAAVGGIVPPMTRLLTSLGNDAVKQDFVQAAGTIALNLPAPSLVGILWAAFAGRSSEDTTEAAAAYTQSALFSAGAVEVFLMAKLFSNEAFMKGIMDAASSGLGMMKGLAATAV